MNVQNGQGEKIFCVVFCSTRTLVVQQYKHTDIIRMFLANNAEYPVARDMRRIFDQFLTHSVPGKYMTVTLLQGTPMVVFQVNKTTSEESSIQKDKDV